MAENSGANGVLMTRIADILGVSVLDFYHNNQTAGDTSLDMGSLGVSELVEAYLQIPDEKTRQRCITLVRSISDKTLFPDGIP